VGVENDVPSTQDCCRACTALNVNATRRVCTVFNYCSQPGGCVYKHKQDDSKSVELEQGQCELINVWQSPRMGCPRCTGQGVDGLYRPMWRREK